MANFGSCLLVDKAVYSNFSLIVAAINPIILSSIKMFEEVIPDSSAVPGDVLTYKPDIFFMGIMTQKLLQQNAIAGFQLDEISTAGINTGKKFYVQVTNMESKDWLENHSMKTLNAARENKKLLFVLKNIPFKINSKNEVHFSVLPGQGTISVKQFCDSAFRVGILKNQQHLTLAKAAAQAGASSGPLYIECAGIYGVVTSVLKEPTVTRFGNFHGMVLIRDPSCCEVLPASQNPEICVHFFLDAYPKMNVGDVLKLKNVITHPSLGNFVDFLVSSRNPGQQVIVFPASGDQEEPFGPYDSIYVTDRDFEIVDKLKRWYRDPANYINIPVLPQPPTPAILDQVVPDNTSNHEWISNKGIKIEPIESDFDTM